MERAGRRKAQTGLAELGRDRQRFTSDQHLAAEAGVAPLTYQSGRAKAVTFRWACNDRLRAVLTCLADNSRHASSWASRVIWRAWVDRKPYDPSQHRAAQRLNLAAG